jgi:hypothetical protein
VGTAAATALQHEVLRRSVHLHLLRHRAATGVRQLLYAASGHFLRKVQEINDLRMI